MKLGALTLAVQPPAAREGLRITSRLARVCGPELVRFLGDAIGKGGPDGVGPLAGILSIVGGDPQEGETGPEVVRRQLATAIGSPEVLASIGEALIGAYGHPESADLVVELCACATAGPTRLDADGLKGLSVSPLDAVQIAAWVASEAGFFRSQISRAA